jgi:group I intron endonuclease
MDNINYKIYKITNIVTNKVYIGITRRSIEKRFDNHIKNSKKPKYKLHRSMHKHGVHKFIIETICENLNKVYFVLLN